MEVRRREQIALPSRCCCRPGILVATVPFIMLQWGFDGRTSARCSAACLFGFQIGPARISILTVIAAVLLFAAGYIAAKIFHGLAGSSGAGAGGCGGQRASFHPHGRGLSGRGHRALIAVSYAGLDISNLAIVAGALSVGIGFGLQSIVNNFVSGLILLAERRSRWATG